MYFPVCFIFFYENIFCMFIDFLSISFINFLAFAIFMFEQFISSQDTVFLSNLLLSLLIGYVLGLERESKGKTAGISTQTLVIAGSMIFTYLSSSIIGGDPARIAAAVVSGIGFLGAGMIFRDNRNRVSNLTTAATVWFASSIGMAIGFGYQFIAISACIFALVAIRIPRPVFKTETRTRL